MASSFLQPAMTILSWSHSFTKLRYSDYTPNSVDSEETLNLKWKSWLEQEGRKRLVMHTFLHDSQVAIAHMQNRLISPAQMMLPLPAARDLWFAPNAHAWRNVYLAKQPPLQSALPSVMETFSNLSVLHSLTGVVDKSLCILVACHALAHEVWQSRQQSQLLADWQKEGRRDRWLTHLSR
ncbi:C6 transcription factor-like protein [Dothistroma septosporum NZE10]|uniref:C6 transcription factor-like protein n=1 Tax=Dothistroma septosporum (strain NZE10 / CBS 128990) TaxID=675120 RepID=N1PF83_DOTSN|nr:C6 transcription factor-like protein [Dothistroma septosporum NZE10]